MNKVMNHEIAKVVEEPESTKWTERREALAQFQGKLQEWDLENNVRRCWHEGAFKKLRDERWKQKVEN